MRHLWEIYSANSQKLKFYEMVFILIVTPEVVQHIKKSALGWGI